MMTPWTTHQLDRLLKDLAAVPLMTGKQLYAEAAAYRARQAFLQREPDRERLIQAMVDRDVDQQVGRVRDLSNSH